jgi:hypothetical protein
MIQLADNLIAVHLPACQIQPGTSFEPNRPRLFERIVAYLFEINTNPVAYLLIVFRLKVYVGFDHDREDKSVTALIFDRADFTVAAILIGGEGVDCKVDVKSERDSIPEFGLKNEHWGPPDP